MTIDRDVDGKPIVRGDYVDVLSLYFASLAEGEEIRKLGVAQIQHIIHEGRDKGIHLVFKNGQKRIVNTGLCLVKVDSPD